MPKLIKPAMWGVTPAFVAPEWQSIRSKTITALPLWDGGATAYDVMGRHDGTLVDKTGLPAWGSSTAGRGLDLSGVGGYVNLGDVVGINGATKFTVEAYFQVNSYTSLDAITTREGETSSDTAFIMRLATATTLNFYIRFTATGVVTIPAGKPVHVVGVFDGANTTSRLYVNGVLGSENTSAPSSAGTKPASGYELLLGASARGSNEAYDRPMDGFFLKAAYYSEPLTPLEVAMLAKDPFGPFRMYDEAGVVYGVTAAGSTIPIFDKHYRSMRAA